MPWSRAWPWQGSTIVPILCLAAAVVSVAKRRRRGSLVAGVAVSKAPEALDGMSWQDFELLVGEAFRLQGYEVTELGGAGPDGGVDLVLRRGREKFLVQCKQWKAFKVGVAVVRELYGAMAAKGAAGGFVRHVGQLHGGGDSICKRAQCHLSRRAEALGLIQQAKAARGSQGRADAPVARRPATPFPAIPAAVPAASATACPDVLRPDGAAGCQTG